MTAFDKCMAASGARKAKISNNAKSRIEAVAGELENYARRGVFRGFSRGPVGKSKAAFRLVWHRDRAFDFIFDFKNDTMRFPLVLPNVPPNSKMYGELKAFILSRHSDDVPEHRRVDTGKARARCFNRGGNVSITMAVVNRDYQYCTRKLVNLVHEIFMAFLIDGSYYEYMVETFDLDPDQM